MKAEIKSYLVKQKTVFEVTRDHAKSVVERTKPQPAPEDQEPPKKPGLKEQIKKVFAPRSPNIDKTYNEARLQLNTAQFNVNQLEKCIAFIDAIKE
jgi:hypothetical protein